MTPVSREAQQVAAARVVCRKDGGVSERRKCQNTIQVRSSGMFSRNAHSARGLDLQGDPEGYQRVGDEGLEPPTSRM